MKKLFLEMTKKGLLLFFMLGFFMSDYIEINDSNPADLAKYRVVMLSCLLSFALTIIPKIRKVSYTAFALCFSFYLYLYNSTEEFIVKRTVIRCLETGKIYDPIQKICRDDCIKWDKELGCLKEE